MADTPNPAPAAPKENPWGDDFDAAKAWALVTNLRAEKETLRTEVTTLKAASQEHAATVEDLQGKLTAAEARATSATHGLAVAKVIRDFPDLDGFEDLLVGDTEEEIRKKAERLAAIGKKPDGKKPKGDDPAEDDKPGDKDGADKGAGGSDSGLPGRPAPALKPGHGGEPAAPFDPAKIALAARSAD